MKGLFRTFICCLFSLAMLAQAQEDNPRGEFYFKDQVKGFFSMKGEYRGFFHGAVQDVNEISFLRNWGYATIIRDTANEPIDTVSGYNGIPGARDLTLNGYDSFGRHTLGLGLEVGAQYRRLLTWVDGFFMPTQVSKAPVAGYRDVKWYYYGANLMFAYMLAPENARLNLIPAVGFGFSSLNVRFANSYLLRYSEPLDPEMNYYWLDDRYYTTFGKDVSAQLELRLNFAQGISLGAYGGVRMSWFGSFLIENEGAEYFIANNLVGHNSFLGLKLTYTLPSVYEKREKEKM